MAFEDPHILSNNSSTSSSPLKGADESLRGWAPTPSWGLFPCHWMVNILNWFRMLSWQESTAGESEQAPFYSPGQIKSSGEGHNIPLPLTTRACIYCIYCMATLTCSLREPAGAEWCSQAHGHGLLLVDIHLTFYQQKV